MELASFFSLETLLTFLLVLTRLSGLMISAPFFTDMQVPVQVKIGLAMALSFLMFPTLIPASGHALSTYPKDLIAFSLLATQEFSIGIILGFASSILFAGVRMAGELAATQMGVSMTTLIDPMHNMQLSILSQFYFWFALVLFMMFNLHHHLIAVFHNVFTLLPIGQPLLALKNSLVANTLEMTRGFFEIGIMLSLPVLGTLLISEIAIGFMAKVMPQMNVFIIGIPIKILIGMFILMAALPYMMHFMEHQFEVLIHQLSVILKPT
jgi:flagellar biosynthesis protein FliR